MTFRFGPNSGWSYLRFSSPRTHLTFSEKGRSVQKEFGWCCELTIRDPLACATPSPCAKAAHPIPPPHLPPTSPSSPAVKYHGTIAITEGHTHTCAMRPPKYGVIGSGRSCEGMRKCECGCSRLDATAQNLAIAVRLRRSCTTSANVNSVSSALAPRSQPINQNGR